MIREITEERGQQPGLVSVGFKDRYFSSFKIIFRFVTRSSGSVVLDNNVDVMSCHVTTYKQQESEQHVSIR